jgi:hypothetical protein
VLVAFVEDADDAAGAGEAVSFAFPFAFDGAGEAIVVEAD